MVQEMNVAGSGFIANRIFFFFFLCFISVKTYIFK